MKAYPGLISCHSKADFSGLAGNGSLQRQRATAPQTTARKWKLFAGLLPVRLTPPLACRRRASGHKPGLRRGELLALRWDSIDFGRQFVTVEGGTAKSRQTLYIALNDEAMGALNRWREQTGGGRRVFEVSNGFKTAWAKLLKRALSRNSAGTTSAITLLRA